MDKRQANEAVAAPAKPLVLGERVYACSPPTPSTITGIGALARKACTRQTPLAVLVNDPAFRELPREAQLACARIAAEAQVDGKQTVDPFELVDQMFTPPVLTFAVWSCCRQNHPGLTLEEVRAAITEDNAAEVFDLFNEASGMLDVLKKNSTGPSGSPESGTSAGLSSTPAGSPSAA